MGMSHLKVMLCRLVFSYGPFGPIIKEQRFHLHCSVSLKTYSLEVIIWSCR